MSSFHAVTLLTGVLLWADFAAAGEPAAVVADSVATVATVAADSVAADSVKPARKGLIGRVIDYFGNANKPKKDPSKFDVSFIGGPYYSDEVKFAIGLVAAGNYRLGVPDTLVPPSVVALKTKFSISGFVEVGVEGTNIFPHDSWRLLYDLRFRHLPTYYWGIGYGMCHDDANKSKYTEVAFLADVKMLGCLGRHFYLGPALLLDISNAHSVKRPATWGSQPHDVTSFGIGVEGSFDTRDNLTAPTRGVSVNLCQRFLPRFLGNGNYGFSFTELTVNAYQRAWRGAVIAEQLHGRWAYGNDPLDADVHSRRLFAHEGIL